MDQAMKMHIMDSKKIILKSFDGKKEEKDQLRTSLIKNKKDIIYQHVKVSNMKLYLLSILSH